MEFNDPRLPPRFWSKVRANEETDCWEWTASKGRGGYGCFTLDGYWTSKIEEACHE